MIVDSSVVLVGQTIAYTFYVLAIMSVMAWFAWRVTREGKSTIRPALFYGWVAFLVVLGVSLHLITYYTIPWKPLDLNRAEITPDRVFDLTVAEHRFHLPSDKLEARCHEKVLFRVTSDDLTYGFGVFRSDHSMVFQMQVLPGHMNDILWEFKRGGSYTIRSTEYSGPAGVNMKLEDVLLIACDETTAS